MINKYNKLNINAIYAILIIGCLLLNGCTITHIGASNTDGNRWITVIGMPTQVEDNGVKFDNRLSMPTLKIDRINH